MKLKNMSGLLLLLIVAHISASDFEPEIYFKKQFPKVSGAFQCGGPGEFVELRYEGCPLGGEMCKIDIDDGINGEMDYIPIKDIETLRLKIYAGVGGKEPHKVYDEEIPDSSVEAGYRYTVSIQGALDEEMEGEKLKERWELLNTSDDSLRVCMEVEVMVK